MGVRRGEKNESSEYYFFNKIDDAYAYMDIEATKGLSLEKFRENNLRGARKIMPDAIIKICEYRIINGLKVLYTDIIGTLDNYKAEFLMYTYINEKGAVYVTVSNSQEKFSKYREIYEEFLNGIVSL